eukprot:Colp12_sorted_trinity150504_noHs@11180
MALTVPLSFEELAFDTDGWETESSRVQEQVEEEIEQRYTIYKKVKECNTDRIRLQREDHIRYLKSSLFHLSTSLQCLDASRPWLCYWLLHALDLLGVDMSPEDADKFSSFLSCCQSPEGGFGGGPDQYAHLAPTYAAVNSLAILGHEKALRVVDRKKLYQWLEKLKGVDGSFAMHIGGEADVRGAYCAIAVAKICNLPTEQLFAGTSDWIARYATWKKEMDVFDFLFFYFVCS